MNRVSLIEKNIYRIDTGLIEESGMRFVSYLVAGNPAAVIESGPTRTVPALLESMQQIGQDPAHIAYIIPTHIHIDHAGGAGRLAELWPQAKVVLHDQGARHLIEPSKLIAGTKRAFGEGFEKLFGPIVAVPEARAQIVHGGEVLPLLDRQLEILYTPGHAPHHISIHDTATRGLFCGEALGMATDESEFILPAAIPPNFDIEATLDTIEKIAKRAPQMLFYSHYGVRRDVQHCLESLRTNLRMVGDFVRAGMKDLKSEKDVEVLARRLKDEFTRRGFFAEQYDFTSMVAGYLFYFQQMAQRRNA